MRGLGIYCYS